MQAGAGAKLGAPRAFKPCAGCHGCGAPGIPAIDLWCTQPLHPLLNTRQHPASRPGAAPPTARSPESTP